VIDAVSWCKKALIAVQNAVLHGTTDAVSQLLLTSERACAYKRTALRLQAKDLAVTSNPLSFN
jgi:hypothetical protein